MIPWAAILRHAPAILAAADALRAPARPSSGEDKGRHIEARLSSLEQGSRDSAQLLQDIAQQIQALAVAQEIAVRRARIAVGVAIAAGVVAICAGILAFYGRRLSNVDVDVDVPKVAFTRARTPA